MTTIALVAIALAPGALVLIAALILTMRHNRKVDRRIANARAEIAAMHARLDRWDAEAAALRRS